MPRKQKWSDGEPDPVLLLRNARVRLFGNTRRVRRSDVQERLKQRSAMAGVERVLGQ